MSRHNELAGKRKSGKTRHGNPIVRYLLCEATKAARRTKTVFRAKYESLVIRRGHKKTIIALAHKLVRTIFCVLIGANLIATQLSITKLRASPRTPRAGSEPSRNTGTGRRSPLQARRSWRPQADPSCTPQIGIWGP